MSNGTNKGEITMTVKKMHVEGNAILLCKSCQVASLEDQVDHRENLFPYFSFDIFLGRIQQRNSLCPAC